MGQREEERERGRVGREHILLMLRIMLRFTVIVISTILSRILVKKSCPHKIKLFIVI